MSVSWDLEKPPAELLGKGCCGYKHKITEPQGMAGISGEWAVPQIWMDWKAAAAMTGQRSVAVGDVNTARMTPLAHKCVYCLQGLQAHSWGVIVVSLYSHG